MNVGKVREVETIKGYKINRKAIGCKFHPWCYDCPFPDCIRGQNYDDTMTEHGKQLTEREREIRIKQAATMGGFGDHFEEALKKYRYREPDFHADWQPIEDGNPSPGLYYITWEGKINAAGNVRRYIEMAEFYLENEYDEDSGRWNLDHITERNYTDIKVIAWMDLPDKYEGDLV